MKRQVTALLLTASLLVQSMAWAEQLGTPSDLPTESPAPTAAATTEAPPPKTATPAPSETATAAPTEVPTMTPQPEDTPQPDGPGGEDNDRPGGGGRPSGGGKPSGGMPSGNGQVAAPTAATDLTVATTHVKSDTTAVVAYDGVELTVTAEPMLTLEIGGETLPLTLANTDGEAAAFTAALTALKENDGTADTLLLTAADAEAVTWRFTGEVSKTLAASGAAYLTLQVGQQALVLPTEELLGGLRYAMYREKGLGSSAFLYEVQMDAAGSVVFRVTVGSDVWEISRDDTALLYYREIYNGPADVLAREQ